MSRRLLRKVAVLSVCTAASATPSGAEPVPSVFGGRIACAEVEEGGVQFCQGGLGARVESFDGVPLDVNVTLPPAAQDGPFPLIVDLHGFGGTKSGTPAVARATAGYVAVSYTARGFGESCGSLGSRATDPTLANPDVCTQRGWVRLGDARYEARDTQHLAGLLVDEGLVLPTKVAATGASYGGGQSMILAALRNRVMLPDGTYAPWQSPGGTPMELAAAAPLIPWSDLAEALAPAGRSLDTRIENPYGTRAGVMKKSWVDLLYLVGAIGFFAPIGVDPEADIPGWKAFLDAGEPYDGVPFAEAMLDEVTAHHSAYYVDDSIAPAPLFIYNAWTDDLFPADEAVRFALRTRAHHPSAEVALHLADAFGHPRAGLNGDLTAIFARLDQFLDRHLKGTGDALPGVEAYTQACGTATVAGPFLADDWPSLAKGEVRFATKKKQSFDPSGGDATIATGLDPIGGGPCRSFAATVAPGTASYALPPAAGAGYTLLGAPTVVADLLAHGSFAQVAARLWDVDPDGQQTLVSHSFYRPRTDNANPQVFQLHPNGWHFAAGHAPKLELLGQSVPFGRASTGAFTVEVKRLELRLPVAETPSGRTILAKAEPVAPPNAEEPADAGTPACPAAPADTCALAGGGSLEIHDDADPARDLLLWKWSGDGEPWGDATATAAFRLCVYDGSGALVANTAAPAGGLCGAPGKRAKACWKRSGRSQSFADPAAATEGLRGVALRSDKSGARAAKLRAEGEALTLPALPLAQPVRVQLVGSRGACWAAEFAAPASENTSTAFSDRED
ncbi:MAG TPA: CocE/NonD family hydrolase [Myxococcota bacterium]|nr:CocE/NonD family hydrolase [Myxococcota bacterium]